MNSNDLLCKSTSVVLSSRLREQVVSGEFSIEKNADAISEGVVDFAYKAGWKPLAFHHPVYNDSGLSTGLWPSEDPENFDFSECFGGNMLDTPPFKTYKMKPRGTGYRKRLWRRPILYLTGEILAFLMEEIKSDVTVQGLMQVCRALVADHELFGHY